ncbi:MAG TPA: secretin N-terminal domain-containing protein [Gemmatimonadaceae bacterium]
MRSRSLLAAALMLGLPFMAEGQDPRDLPVRTFKLQNLRAEDAAKLLGPYVNAPNGGVFDAGSINAITVRETHSVLALVDSLLRVHDRPRASVTLRFQLIAALDTNHRDPAIAGIDTELRRLFRFAGYELLGEGSARTEELREFTVSLSTKPKVTLNNERIAEAFQLQGWIEGVQGTADARTVRLNVALQSAMQGKDAPDLLRTGLTMPVGQSVILGSARPTMSVGNRVALILVVAPEVGDGPGR